jgi:MFS family permease
MTARFHVPIGALGLVTIAAYGVWIYSFGVLLDPMILAEGWSEAVLTVGFGGSIFVAGLMAVVAGKFLDRTGSRPVFLAAAFVGTGFLVLSASAPSAPWFVVTGGVGGAAVGALGHYHVTQATAVRVAPDDPTRALAWLTILGAFSSAIYLPLAAWLVDRFGWRDALRTLAVITGAVFVVAALVVREEVAVHDGSRPRIRDALRDRYTRRFFTAVAFVGLTIGIVVVYQVPLMTDAGLALGTAAWFAGARGLAQVTGRIPLTPLVGRFGTQRALVISYTSMAVGLVLLWFSGDVVVAGIFVLVMGFGVGAASPLHGLHADELFDRSGIGALMGMVAFVLGIGTALGPAIAGVLAETTGTRGWAIVVGAASALAAAALLRRARTGVTV